MKKRNAWKQRARVRKLLEKQDRKREYCYFREMQRVSLDLVLAMEHARRLVAFATYPSIERRIRKLKGFRAVKDYSAMTARTGWSTS